MPSKLDAAGNIQPTLLHCDRCHRDRILPPSSPCPDCGKTMVTVVFNAVDGKRITRQGPER